MRSIWLVDDDKISLFISEKIIQAALTEFSIKKFSDSTLALNEYKTIQKKPDLVFVDINMPMLNGWDFLDDIMKSKNIYSDFYILTSSDYLPELIRSQKYHFIKGYILKPLTSESLEKILLKKAS